MKRAPSSWLAPLLAAGAVVLSYSGARAQLAHWTSAAGGTLSDPTNWDTGRPPDDHTTAVFGLGADYTVNLGASASVGALTVEQGTVGLDAGPFRLDVGLTTFAPVSIGAQGAPSATLRLLSGAMHIDSSSVLVGNAAGATGTFIIEQGAQFLDDNGYGFIGGNGGVGYLLLRGGWTDAGVSKFKYLYAGSTIRVESSGSFDARSLTLAGGRLEVDGGRFNAAGWGGWGEVHASNGARITTEDHAGLDSGSIVVESGATLDAYPCDGFNADVLVDGPQSQIAGEYVGTGGSLTLRNGGALTTSFEASFSGQSEIYVGPGSSIQVGTDFSMHGLLHAEQGATLALGWITLYDDSTLEFALDGAGLPSTPLITGGGTPRLAGAVRPIFSHTNNLRIGDQVELLRISGGGIGPMFSSLDCQPLGGGRQLQLVSSAQSVFLRVVAGGPSCWSTDFNGDGDPATDADIEAFFACIAGNCCATCGSPDFNGDGEEATDGDIEAFFRVIAGGPC